MVGRSGCINTPAPWPLRWANSDVCVLHCFQSFLNELKLQSPTVVAVFLSPSHVPRSLPASPRTISQVNDSTWSLCQRKPQQRQVPTSTNGVL